MANRFLHIGCMFPGAPKTAAVDQALTVAGEDWVRYAVNNWIMWTPRSPTDLYAIIKPALAADDQFLVAEINLGDRNGWMAKWIWEWMDARRAGQQVPLAEILRRLPPPPPPPPPPYNPLSLFSNNPFGSAAEGFRSNALAEFLKNKDKK